MMGCPSLKPNDMGINGIKIALIGGIEARNAPNESFWPNSPLFFKISVRYNPLLVYSNVL